MLVYSFPLLLAGLSGSINDAIDKILLRRMLGDFVMTEKDAIKCVDFKFKNLWYIQVEAVLPKDFLDQVIGRIVSLQVSRKISVQKNLFDVKLIYYYQTLTFPIVPLF